PDKPGRFAMNVRVPGWARGEALPGDLYRFEDASSDPVTLKVNGQSVPVAPEKGYARIDRAWKAGDVVDLSLPMPIRRVMAKPAVEADQGRVALQRDPSSTPRNGRTTRAGTSGTCWWRTTRN